MKRREFVSVAATSALSGCASTTLSNLRGGRSTYRVRELDVETTSLRGPDDVLQFEIAVPDDIVSPSSPGTFEFSVSNEKDYPVRVSSGVVPPFGVPLAKAVNSEEGVELWREEYVENQNVQVRNGEVVGQTKQSIRTTLAPRETVTKEYLLRAQNGVETGEYAIEGVLPFYNHSHQVNGTLRYEISFRVVRHSNTN